MAHAPIGMILSAGFGSRLMPLTDFRPKPVMELFGQPIIYWLIKMLEKASIKDIFINLHYQPEQVKKALLRCDIKARLHFSYEKELLGTAGALHQVLNRFNIKDRKMLLLHGDILCDTDLARFLEYDDFCTILCAKDRQIKGYQGGVAIDRSGQIVELGRFYRDEKSFVARGFFTGIHCLSSEALALIKQDGRKDLVGQIYPSWLKEKHKIKAIMDEMHYEDLGSKERLYNANMAIDCSPFHRSFLDDYEKRAPKIFTGKKAHIDQKTEITGTVIIGQGSLVKGALVGPNVIIGKNCLIKEGAVISNSVVISDTVIEKDERVDCMIGVSGARVKIRSSVY